MLPVYHRQYDAKLLLLTVPACAMLWAEGGPIGWIALLVNTAGFVLTGDIPSAIFLGLIGKLQVSTTGLTGQIVTAAQVFPTPLVLLLMGIFYLWVYVRRGSEETLPQPSRCL
jgi:ABC-type Fe3+-siderophore transport system permease subunit